MEIIEFTQKYWLDWPKHFKVTMRNKRLKHLEDIRIKLFEYTVQMKLKLAINDREFD